MNIQEPFTLLGVVLVFAAFGYILYRLDTWRLLAKRYRTSLPPSGQRWGNQRVWVGTASKPSKLALTTNADGLFLETPWPWRPRLFIPWQDFYGATRHNYQSWHVLEVQVGDPRIARLVLDPEVFEKSEGQKVLANA